MTSRRISRRLLPACLGAGLIVPPAFAAEPEAELFPTDPAAALERLKGGNGRFAEGTTRHAHQSADWRKHLVGEQHPFATILGCSDSRVPIELVFDQGFGDLFVVRVAGNVIAADVVGSIAYAAIHLRTPLFVVMGHLGCGAVTAALNEKIKQTREPQNIENLLKLIDPALREIDPTAPFAAQVEAAVEANVRWSIRQLAAIPSIKQALDKGTVALAGSVYDLATGKVRFLKD